MNVGIYIYPEAEVLDFSGPFEVFSTASRLSDPRNLFSVCLIAEKEEPVPARGGFCVHPHYTINNHPSLDLLITAGGIHTGELEKPHVIRWIKETAASTTITASVCTGAFLLAEAGLLEGLDVTTHWEDIPDLRAGYPALNVLESKRWIDNGGIVTSAGISAGIDMSLHLVERLQSPELARKTARQMEYDRIK